MNASWKALVASGIAATACSLAGTVSAQPAPPEPPGAVTPLPPGYPFDVQQLPAFRERSCTTR